jgi:hypothetical protein
MGNNGKERFLRWHSQKFQLPTFNNSARSLFKAEVPAPMGLSFDHIGQIHNSSIRVIEKELESRFSIQPANIRRRFRKYFGIEMIYQIILLHLRITIMRWKPDSNLYGRVWIIVFPGALRSDLSIQ